MVEASPTRSALLELYSERAAMREGYAFLDETRLLLAAEMVRQLVRYEQAQRELVALHDEAVQALREALARHGLQGLQGYPALAGAYTGLRLRHSALLRVALLEAELLSGQAQALPAPNASPEAERCRDLFHRLVRRAAPLAAIGGNLERLLREYRRTERRTRALEDVLLPEIDQAVARIESALEDLEREEATRGRLRSHAD